MDGIVSIITPSYNTERFIGETIQSVIDQTYENWEMIIVDDCSTDNSVQVINSFCDSRIRLLVNEKNSGAAVSRNRALREAKGRWVAFLDSDDVWLSQKLEKQIIFMEEQGYHFSYSEYMEIDESSLPSGTMVTGPKVLKKSTLKNFCYPGCLTVMYDASYVGLVQIEDLPKNNDYAIWLKIVEKADCFLLPEIFAKYRKREGSISNQKYVQLIKYHYFLWRNGEHKGWLESIVLTLRNLFFGVSKKFKYVKNTGE